MPYCCQDMSSSCSCSAPRPVSQMYFPGASEEEGVPGNISRCSVAGTTPSWCTCYCHTATKQILGRNECLSDWPDWPGTIKVERPAERTLEELPFPGEAQAASYPARAQYLQALAKPLEMSMCEVLGPCWVHGLPWAGCGFSWVDLAGLNRIGREGWSGISEI